MASVRLQWSTYDFSFAEFTGGDLPRTFLSTANLTRSATGAQVYGGAPYTAKYLWTIDTVVTKERGYSVMQMFAAFDASRSVGELPVIAVTDTTCGPELAANAVFTTPPSMSRFGGASSNLYALAFAITQV